MDKIIKKLSIISGNTIKDWAKKTGCNISNITVAIAITGEQSFLLNIYVAHSVAIEKNNDIECSI